MRLVTAARTGAEVLYDRIQALASGPAALMEVCGTHTMAIGRHGIRSRLPDTLRLLSGPGCPVCVTPGEWIDEVATMAGEPGVTVATFGDMMRVPGGSTSLESARAVGADVRVVYSAAEALDLALALKERLVVLFGIGFETTCPTVAATLVRADRLGARNFLLYPAFKLVPPAMAALVEGGGARIDGFICPGHVGTVIGATPFEPLARAHSIPCVITGFEATDILEGLIMLLEQRAGGSPRVEIQYARAVRPGGNPVALDTMARVFRPCDSRWRGIGTIPGSGLELTAPYAGYDARDRIPVALEPGEELPRACACGEVMRGLIVPPECKLFGKACIPSSPVGPCMVSSEGACAAHYRYGGRPS